MVDRLVRPAADPATMAPVCDLLSELVGRESDRDGGPLAGLVAPLDLIDRFTVRGLPEGHSGSMRLRIRPSLLPTLFVESVTVRGAPCPMLGAYPVWFSTQAFRFALTVVHAKSVAICLAIIPRPFESPLSIGRIPVPGRFTYNLWSPRVALSRGGRLACSTVVTQSVGTRPIATEILHREDFATPRAHLSREQGQAPCECDFFGEPGGA